MRASERVVCVAYRRQIFVDRVWCHSEQTRDSRLGCTLPLQSTSAATPGLRLFKRIDFWPEISSTHAPLRVRAASRPGSARSTVGHANVIALGKILDGLIGRSIGLGSFQSSSKWIWARLNMSPVGLVLANRCSEDGNEVEQ
jgi:hypothetical protein